MTLSQVRNRLSVIAIYHNIYIIYIYKVKVTISKLHV